MSLQPRLGPSTPVNVIHIEGMKERHAASMAYEVPKHSKRLSVPQMRIAKHAHFVPKKEHSHFM